MSATAEAIAAQTITLAGNDVSALVSPLLTYAHSLEQQSHCASAASYFDLAAQAAAACGWDDLAASFRCHVDACRAQADAKRRAA
jgi:hypothetical protein